MAAVLLAIALASCSISDSRRNVDYFTYLNMDECWRSSSDGPNEISAFAVLYDYGSIGRFIDLVSKNCYFPGDRTSPQSRFVVYVPGKRFHGRAQSMLGEGIKPNQVQPTPRSTSAAAVFEIKAKVTPGKTEDGLLKIEDFEILDIDELGVSAKCFIDRYQDRPGEVEDLSTCEAQT